MGLFRTIAGSLIALIFVYVSHQLTRFTDLTWIGTLSLIAFLAFLFSLVIGTFLFFWKEKNLDHNPWRDRLLDVSLSIMAYINFLVSIVILRDLFAFSEKWVFSSTYYENIYSTKATYAMLALPVAFLVLGNLTIQAGPRLKKVPLYFKNLSAEMNGLRILHITDLHIGPNLSISFVRNLVRKALELKPDLIVFTGDILDSFREKHEEEFRLLRELHAPFGIYYVPGNHEYYWNPQNSLQAFRDIGFHVLINQVKNISVGNSVLQMAGIPDPAALHFRLDGPDLPAVQKHFLPGSFKVLLSHQPSLAPKVEALGVDLQLSGHTHGGQFFPWNWLIIFFEKYAKGLYRIGNMQLYVNQGTGYWGPRLRLGTYCELTEIILRKDLKTE